ncbi:MAG: hypothetical protein U0Q18_32570 [Bryobacteraceae bacterium]
MAFIAQAIEQNEFYRREMVQFVQDRFPELRAADNSKSLGVPQGAAMIGAAMIGPVFAPEPH